MTLSKENIGKIERKITFNRVMYGAFVALSIYFLLANKDISSAMSNLGIALIFDPFDQKVMWSNRPIYQRIWLLVHVSLVFLLLIMLLAGVQ